MNMSHNRGKVLIADDESHILNVLSLKLKNAGYDVLTAVDGEEALELAREQRPNLIITDYQMPVITGLELCQRLRAEQRTEGIPAIMLTARGFDLEPAEMTAAGIVGVLAKPFSPRQVLGKVDELITAGVKKIAEGA